MAMDQEKHCPQKQHQHNEEKDRTNLLDYIVLLSDAVSSKPAIRTSKGLSSL